MLKSARTVSLLVLLTSAIVAAWPATALAATLPPLGTAGNYAVLAGSTVTNTGLTWISGQVGLSPGTSVTGFPPGTSGHQDVANGAAGQAKIDLGNAYTNAAGQTPFTTLTGNLGNQTLVAGTYRYAADAGLTGPLTLDGQNLVSNVWIFQIGMALTTASSSSVVLINGASACQIFWQIGSSATLGTSTVFRGNIMAGASITMTTNAFLEGRAMAQTGAVTLDTNRIIQPTGCGYAAPGAVPSPAPPTPTPTPTPTPAVGFPNTGGPPQQPGFPWLPFGIAGALGALLLGARIRSRHRD